MMLPRRPFLQLTVSIAALSVASRFAWAQNYPTRALRMIVGDAPGGAPDIVARLMGEWLSERLGQRILVENRPGAGGTVAMAIVGKAPPDAYTLALVGTSAATSATLYQNLDYDLIRDIAPVTGLVQPFGHGGRSGLSPPKLSPSSSPTPKPIPPRSIWRRRAMARAARGRRTIQHDVGQQHDLRPLSWRTRRFDRCARRSSTSLLCRGFFFDREYQSRQTEGACCNHSNAMGEASRRPGPE